MSLRRFALCVFAVITVLTAPVPPAQAAPGFTPLGLPWPSSLAKPPMAKCCALIFPCCRRRKDGSNPDGYPSYERFGSGGPIVSTVGAPVTFGGPIARAAIRIHDTRWSEARVDTLGPWAGWIGAEYNVGRIVSHSPPAATVLSMSCGWSTPDYHEFHKPAWWVARYDTAGALLGWYRQDVDVLEGEARGGVSDVVGDQRETFVVGWADFEQPGTSIRRPARMHVSGDPLAGAPGTVTAIPLPTLCTECDGVAEAMTGRAGALGVETTDTTVVVGWSMDPANEDRTLPVFWGAGVRAGIGPRPVGVLPLPDGFDRGQAIAVTTLAPETNSALAVAGWTSNAAGDTAATTWHTPDGGRTWSVGTLPAAAGRSRALVVSALGPAPGCPAPCAPPRYVGLSWNAPGDEVATLWEDDPALGLVAHDLNTLTTGLPAGTMLRVATGAVGEGDDLSITGWGTAPGAGGAPPQVVAWALTAGGTVGVGPDAGASLRLSCAPNPARSEVGVSFAVPAAARVRLTVQDIAGRTIATLADEWTAAGPQRRVWRGDGADGGRVAPGVYVVRLAVGESVRTAKIVLDR